MDGMLHPRSLTIGSLALLLLAPARAQDGQTLAVEVGQPTLQVFADPEMTQPIGTVTGGQVYVQIDSEAGMAKILWSQAGPTYAWLEEGELLPLKNRDKFLVVEPTGCGPLGTTPGWLVAPMGKSDGMEVGPETNGLMVLAHAGDTYLVSTKHLLQATDHSAARREKRPERRRTRSNPDESRGEPDRPVADRASPTARPVADGQQSEPTDGKEATKDQIDGGEGSPVAEEPAAEALEDDAPESQPAAGEAAAAEPAAGEPATEATPAADEPQPDLPNSRRGFVQLPAGGRSDGYYCYGPAARRWGTEELVYGLMRSARRWAATPNRPRIGIGDLSLENGGPIYSVSNGERRLAHRTHQAGRDADIRPVRSDRREAPVTIDAAAYSRPLTQALVDLFRSQELGADDVLFNDGAVRGRRPVRGHHNHLHVTVR